MNELLTFQTQRPFRPAQLGLRLTPHSTIALTSPPWIRSIVNRIDYLLTLSEGWDGPGSGALDFECAMEAISFMLSTAAHETPAPQLIPTSDSGVQIEWHMGGIDLEVRFSPGSSATYYYCAEDVDKEGEVSTDEAVVASLVRSLPPRNEPTISSR
jgi:hypothetical protein